MTVQSSLSTALDTYIQSNFTGTLDQVSASKLNLSSLLQIQRSLSSVLPNGTLINGVANFYASTAPSVRVDGSALIAQDIWNDTTNGIRWVYSGAVWRSPLFDIELNNAVASAHNAFPTLPTNCTTIYIKDFVLAQQSAGSTANNVSNYGTYNAQIRAKATATETLLGSIQNYPLPIAQANNWVATVNQAFTVATYSGVLERAGATVGTNGAYANYTSKLSCQWQI